MRSPRGDRGVARELEENGLPLGLMEVADYQQLEQPLQAGDRFLLYTDGLVDATNAAGEFFSVDRGKATVAAGAGLFRGSGRGPDRGEDARLGRRDRRRRSDPRARGLPMTTVAAT